VSKFVGKFRKDKNYNDDYKFADRYDHDKKTKNEHAEIKKQLKKYYEESEDNEYMMKI